MKPSLYSKIRPASEIKQNHSEFKVANDQIALRVTKQEFGNMKIGGTNLYLKESFSGSGATAVFNKETNEWTLSFSPGTGSWRGLRYSGHTATVRPGETVTISYEVYADFVVNMRADINNHAPGVSGNDNDDLPLRKTDAQPTVAGKWVRHIFQYTMKTADVDPKEYYDGTTIAIDSSFSIAAGQTIKLRNIQMEIGTVATAYSPNPMELETRISSAETKITADAITSTVTSHSSYQTDVGNRVNSGVAQGVKDIRIGGRNFLRNSFPTTPIQNASYNIASFTLSEPIQHGETFTMSIKGDLGADRTGFGIYNTGGMLQVANLQHADRGPDGVYRKTGTWVVTSGSHTAGNTRIDIYQFNSGNTSVSKIEWVKLEKGNKATDWTAAPEDVAASVTSQVEEAKSSVIEQTNNSITSSVTSTKKYIQSRGENLVTNGTGLMGDNTNFTRSVFDKSDAYGANGSFTFTGSWDGPETAELIPVNPDRTYRFKYYVKANPFVAGNRIYGYVACYDADGDAIAPSHTMYRANTTTTLKNTLSPGATTVTLTSAANWYNAGTTTDAHNRSFIFWNFVNKGGYAWPEHTYSRNYYTDMWNAGAVNTSTGVITLKTPWAGPTIPAGTKVSNGSSGGALKYIAGAYSPVTAEWQSFEGPIGTIDYSGANNYQKFHPGTASIKLGWLCNIDVSNSKTWLSNISFELDYQGQIESTKTQITQTSDKISLVVKEESGTNKIDAFKIVSAINLEPNTVKIAAKNINITGAVTFSSFDSTTQSKINDIEKDAGDALTNISNLEVGGVNLFIKKNAVDKYIASLGQEFAPDLNNMASEFIPVVAGSDYTFSLETESGVEAWSRCFWYDSSKTAMTMFGYSVGNSNYSVTVKAPTGAAFARISARHISNNKARMKFEKGNFRTTWSPAPEDVTNDIKVAADAIEVGAKNLLRNSDFKVTETAGSTTSKHPNLYGQFYGGYNGGVANASTSFHAHLDNTTFSFNVYEFNESDGSRNWKGTSPNVTSQVTAAGIGDYMFSFDAYATGAGTKIFGGFYYTKVGTTTTSFHSSQQTVSIDASGVNKWARFSVKHTLLNDVDWTKSISFYIYGYGFDTNSILYIKNLKLEKGNKATGWTPAPEDTLSEIATVDTKASRADELTAGWKATGKTTIDGGKIEADSILVGSLKAGEISTDKISLKSALSGVTFDSTGIKATRGNIVVSMNSGAGFKITNGAEDVFRVESDGMIFAKGLTTLSQFNNLKVGGRNLFRESGNFISAPKSAWSSNGGGMELDQAVSYNGYPTIKTTVGNGMAGQWYTLKNDVEYVYSVTLSANAAFNTTGSSGSSPVHYHAGLNNVHQSKISILEHSTQYLAGDVGKFKRLWIRFKLTGDANSFRPFIYMGSGTTVFNIANMQLEEGNMMTDWTPAPEDAGQDIYDLQERLAAAEQIITSDAITSTVMASQSFIDKVDGKVNIEDLANYATTDALTAATTQLQEYADGKIESIDLSTYVTTTSLTQTKNDFNIKLTSAGGVNLLQNSVGWAGGFNWTVTGSLATDGSGEYEVVKGTSELTGLGAGAAWKLNRRTIEQDVPVVSGETYTFQMLVKKAVNDAGGYILIDEGNNAMVQRHTYRTDTAYNWTPFTYTFKAQGSNVKIRIQNTGTGNTLITNVMLNKGALPMQWTHAKNEIHNTNVRFDLGGIIVQNDATNGETRITPTEFAGYARDETGAQEKIFTLNGDTTEVKKLKASEEFSMGPLRILQIETPSGQTGPNGWAFLPRD